MDGGHAGKMAEVRELKSPQPLAHAIGSDPASASLVAALESDPFYRTITRHYEHAAERRAALSAYFAYSIREGSETGRCVRPADPRLGVAVWLLPQQAQAQADAALRKQSFIGETLGDLGLKSYEDIVRYMKSCARRVVPADAWYLSIIAVHPRSQGQGVGQQLLQPTLREADELGITCYLETFGTRTLRFYERSGFRSRDRLIEPTTGAEYTLMLRHPH